MRNNQYNNELDKLFQEKLRNTTPSYSKEEMEADWNNIQQQLPNQGGASGGHNSASSAFSTMKGWMMATGAAVIVAGGITYYSLNSSSEKADASNQQEQVQQNSKAPSSPSNKGNHSQQGNPKPFGNTGTSSKEPASSLGAPNSESNQSNEQASKVTSNNSSTSSNGNNTDELIKGNQDERREVTPANDETETPSEKGKSMAQNTNSSAAMKDNKDSKVAMFPNVIFSDEQQTTHVFNGKPVVLLSSKNLCKGEQLHLIPQNIPSPTSITYRTSDITQPQPLKERTSIRLNQTGDYHLFFTMETGNESKTLQKNVSVHERPHADFTYEAYGYQKITFKSESQEALIHHWIFGDGVVSKQNNPVHYYTSEGNHQAKLVVKNDQQCKDTAEKKITIEPLPQPAIPDIFTPNGDGKNDVFKIKMKEPIYYHLVIKDDQGNEIYQTNDHKEYWDGINSRTGNKEEGGKYIYQLQYKYKGQKSPITKQGNFHLRYKQ